MKKKNKFLIHQGIILLVLTSFFTIVVFLVNNYYFSDLGKNEEENYIEPTKKITLITDSTNNNFTEIGESKIDEKISGKEIAKLIQERYRAAAPFYFEYFPESFEKQTKNYTLQLSTFLQSNQIKKMVFDIKIELHKPLYDVRGKMKNKILKFFGVSRMKTEEFVGVGIHEFSHYVDIYFLEKKVLQDLSQYFYDISWEKTKVLKPGEIQQNFVSGYAMTNKYEDFAETMTYYILHNGDFLEKTKTSVVLKKKYDFFNIFLFKQGEFRETDFSKNKIRDYYRDITKINIDLENLLQYLKNGI